ncbi:M23 family metallopeptidase [Microbacterium sp. B2969]|uniref:M23 family metallopeptidase n=1 Tax=Microbacterium alkaliflavum TaxID=3248839 RepID=A0ABW7Q317_9MICO
MALNSPADRVPSHGSDLFGTTYAIDFVAVGERRSTGPRDWRTLFGSEPPERFRAFGRPILAPVAGRVVAVHDGETDHEARRSILTLLPYLLTQGSRAAQGPPAIAGNHVVIAAGEDGPFVLVAHLRRGTVRAQVGHDVAAGETLAECGNSGNSTQPHVHVQATDSMHWDTTRGLPIAFADRAGEPWMPRTREVFETAYPSTARSADR